MNDTPVQLICKKRKNINPEFRSGDDSSLTRNRTLISSVFISMLIGIAYKEMLAPVSNSVRVSGFTAGTMFLAFTFFLTSMRFFIGNQLHLLSTNILCMRGDIWLFDFLIVTLQTVLLCFLGGLSSVEVNQTSHVGFFGLLIALYALDIIWVFCQWILGFLFHNWKRPFLPWAWAVLNAVTLTAIIATLHFCPDPYSKTSLAILLGLSAIAFFVDLLLVDHYDVI